MITRIIPPLLFVGLLLGACTDTGHDDPTDTEAAVTQETTDFVAETRAALDEIDRGISELDAQLAEAGEEAEAAVQNSLVALRTQRDKLRQDLARLENSGESVFHQQESVLEERLMQIQLELETARLTAIQGREEFEMAVNARLAEADEMLADLKQQGEKDGAETRSTYSEAVAHFTQKRDELANEVDEMQDASEKTYREMKANLASSIASLHRDLQDAISDLDDADVIEVRDVQDHPAARKAS